MFYSLKIKDIRRETRDCVSIAFDVPSDLHASFAYQAGQYLTLRANIDGQDVRRFYSICSAPLDNEWRVAVKQVEDGVFSTYANQKLKIGDCLDVMPPAGHFTLPPSTNQNQTNHFVFFAAGSGITPVLSIVKTVLKSSETAICTLVYGNRNAANVIFREEIEGLKNRHMGRLRLFHVLSRERVDSDLGFGRIDGEKVNLFCAKIPDILRGDAYFICGPFEMTEAVRDTLKAHGVDAHKIHFELFNAPKKDKNAAPKTANWDNQSLVAVKMDGLTFDVPTPEGVTILDAAQMAGADLPFACKGGVCCTCRAKLTEGQVEMEVNYALTEEEVEAGFILTCQALPKSARCVVDFDVK